MADAPLHSQVMLCPTHTGVHSYDLQLFSLTERETQYIQHVSNLCVRYLSGILSQKHLIFVQSTHVVLQLNIYNSTIPCFRRFST